MSGYVLIINQHGVIGGTWELDHFILYQPGLILGYLIPVTGKPLIIYGIGGEDTGQFAHGGLNDIPVSIGYTVEPPPPPKDNQGKNMVS